MDQDQGHAWHRSWLCVCTVALLLVELFVIFLYRFILSTSRTQCNRPSRPLSTLLIHLWGKFDDTRLPRSRGVVCCVCVCVCVCVWCLLDTVSRIVLLALNMAKVFYCRIYPPHGTCRRWGFYEAQTPDLTNQIARFRYVHVVQFTTVLWIALFHWIIVCLDMLSSLQCGDIINIMWQYPCDDIINIMWQYHP